jgi:adenylate cyclase
MWEYNNCAMPKEPLPAPSVEEIWRTYLTTGRPPQIFGVPWYMSNELRPIVRWLPANPRCRLCYYPFDGAGGFVARHALGIAPSKMNPTVCNLCERFIEANQGGAEVETTVLFADVRGSTALAERISPAEFGQTIRRFYTAATSAIIEHDGMVEKLIGDEVTAFFVSGMTGPGHARAALKAAEAVLRATGHGSARGAWVPVGVGVHTGTAYIGAVRVENGASDVVVLGDTANTGARLASQAGPGEIVISDATRQAAALDEDGWEARKLQLKGRSEAVDAFAYKVGPR